MKASEIKELSVKEIEERIDNEKNFLIKQKLNHAISPLDNPLKIRETKRTIARLETIRRIKLLEKNKET
jgi:large subunit ribosomal protein L29